MSTKPHIYTVTELNLAIKDLIEATLGTVWLTGEITNCQRAASGHYYLSIKDRRTQISAVIWRSTASRLKFEPTDGTQVMIRGEVQVYDKRGVYQVVISRMEPSGIGALRLAFEQLKQKLEDEGLFDPALKKDIPFLPRAIGIVTSPTGAAIEDITSIVTRRYPGMGMVLCPVRVQGPGAAKEIAKAIEAFNQSGKVDLLIVGRGGGSLEDLQAFNEEITARAIAASSIPVISAVGHEIDVSIADLVADLRAATPSEAAEIAVPVRKELEDNLHSLNVRMRRLLMERVRAEKKHLDALSGSHALMQPVTLLRHAQQCTDELAGRLGRAFKHSMEQSRSHLAAIAGKLEELSPLGVLSRGYAVATRDKDDHDHPHPIQSANEVAIGDLIHLRFKKGRIISRVEEIQ